MNANYKVSKLLTIITNVVKCCVQTGWTPLMRAIDCDDDNMEIVKFLLDAGAIINHESIVKLGSLWHKMYCLIFIIGLLVPIDCCL